MAGKRKESSSRPPVDQRKAKGPSSKADGNRHPVVKPPAPSGAGNSAGTVASEDNLSDFIENAAVPLHKIGPDGIILWANQAELDLLGYPREEYVGHHIARFHVDAPVIDDILARLTRGETLRDYEARLRCKDGSSRHVLISSNVLFENGEFIHTRCFTRDVTREKQAEERIKRLNTQLSSDLDGMSRLQECSTRLSETTDLSLVLLDILDAAIEITGADMGNVQLLEGTPGVLKIAAQRGFETPFLEFFNTVHDGLAACGTAMQRGERVIVEDVAGSPVFAGTSAGELMLAAGAKAVQSTPLVTRTGRLLGMFSTHYRESRRPTSAHLQRLDILARMAADSIDRVQADIERKRSEEALQRTVEFDEAVMNNMGEGLYTVDAQGLVTFMNPAAERFFGWRFEELRGRKMHDMTHHHHPDGTPFPAEECAGLQVLMQGINLIDHEDSFIRKDGTFFDVIYSSAPLRSGKEILGLVVVFRDVSERRRAEALAACQKQVFEMAASGVSLLEVLGVLARGTESQSHAGAAVAIHLLGESGKRFEGTAAPTLPSGYKLATEGMEISSAIGPCCKAASSRQRVVVVDVAASEEFPEFASFALPLGIRAGWSTPILSSTGEVLGTVANYYREPREPYRQDDFLGEIVTRTAAIVIERNRIEDAMRRRTAQFETLLSEAPLGVYLVDADFRIREVNPTALSVFGNIPDLVGRDFDEVIHILWPKAYADEVVQLFRHTLETGEPYLTPEQIEERLDRGVFEYYEWQINRCPLPEGSYGVVCYFRDISRQVLAREAIAESEERFRQLADSMPQIVWAARPDGHIDYYNERWYEFTGFTRGEFGQASWEPILHPDDVQPCVDTYFSCIREAKPYQIEYRFKDRFKGGYRWFMGRALPIRNEQGEIIRWFGTCTDIDSQKKVEENLRRANADLEQFAYSASHDLQEPIRNISIYGEVLQKRYGDGLDAKGKQYLSFMTSGARRMESLVKDLLAYTQSGQTANEATEVDATAALTQALDNLAEATRESGAAVSHDDLPTLRMHEVQFQQLFQNLIGNAIKYRRDDEVPRVRVTAERQGAHWRFAVQDNGVGIPPEYKERIFGIFKRLHAGAKYSGTGIGLAICQRIVERNGGRIWVESQGEGKGTTFYFTLPAGEGR